VQYKVEQLGTAFSQKAIDALEAKLNNNAGSGWKFHSVFSIEKTGCMGSSQGSMYLAIFEKN